VTHKCPPNLTGRMPCCGKTLFEVPRLDKVTLFACDVTCEGEGRWRSGD
jgi:hypothetical protein